MRPRASRSDWLASIAGDLRYALRGMRRAPGFSLTVVATLAVGIGANAAVFTIVSAFLLRGFPLVDDNDRIAYVASAGSFCCISYPDFEDLRDQTTVFDGMEVVHGFSASYSDEGGDPEAFDVTEISAGTFRLVGQAPLIGRDFTSADEAPGAAAVAILSYGFWDRRYARDPGVLGRTIRLNGRPATIVGVMPAGFSFPQRQALWLPMIPTASLRQRDNRNLWFAFGRLRDGVSFEAAKAEVETIGERLAAEYPLTNRTNDRPEVLTFNEFFVGADENSIYGSMWGAVAFVLLIACANLANLMLARSIGRAREISVRIALGASRSRIVRQLLTESVLLAAAGGALGWWLASWAVGVYAGSAHGPGWSPWRVLDYAMDYRIALYISIVSVATGLLFGIAPASRLARLDANTGLKAGGRNATPGGSTRRLFDVLVIAQVALAVVLLAGAGIMIRSFLNIATTDPGVRGEGVLTASISLPAYDYPSGKEQAGFYDELERRLTALAGVESVAYTNILPTWGSVQLPYVTSTSAAVDAASRPRVSSIVASPGYFHTLGAAVLAGREFDATDRADSVPVVVVNERFADQHWPGQDAIGKQLRVFGQSDSEWLTVVGVVSNIVQDDATRQSFDPVIYMPHRQWPRAGLWVVLRTRVLPASLAAAFRREIEALDPDLPVRFGPYTLTDRLAEIYTDRSLYVILFSVFAAIALLLASVGLYAVVAHSVSQQTTAIGVRITLGASARSIRALVLRTGMLPIGVGLGLGLALSVVLTRVLQSELVGVSPADPAAYVVACTVLGLAAVLGCLIPARRAIRVDPVIALRHE